MCEHTTRTQQRAEMMLEAAELVLSVGGSLWAVDRYTQSGRPLIGPSWLFIAALAAVMGPLDRSEVAMLYGISRERVRQIEELALHRAYEAWGER